MKNIDVADPQYIFNRHHSWMQFNERVLEEARDAEKSAARAGEVFGDHREQPG